MRQWQRLAASGRCQEPRRLWQLWQTSTLYADRFTSLTNYKQQLFIVAPALRRICNPFDATSEVSLAVAACTGKHKRTNERLLLYE